MRTKIFSVSLENLDKSVLHTGYTLNRKYREIRLVLMNAITPLFSKMLPGGYLPSGKTMPEILQALRIKLWHMNEELASKNSKAAGGYLAKTNFDEDWYPVEWEVFLTYGAASPFPKEALEARSLIKFCFLTALFFHSSHFCKLLQLIYRENAAVLFRRSISLSRITFFSCYNLILY